MTPLAAAVSVAVAALGLGAAAWAMIAFKKGKLTEDMTERDLRTATGDTDDGEEEGTTRRVWEKSFGKKETLVEASTETSLSWGEVREALKRGNVRKLWPIIFLVLLIAALLLVFKYW